MHDRAHCHRNQLKTTMLLASLSVLLILGGGAVGGRVGLVVACGLALAMNAGAYFASDRIALLSMRAYPVSEADHPELCRIVRELATAMRLPIPAVYVSATATPTAFATGRNPRRSTICVTQGLLRLLDQRELRAVIGHELGHVASRDILISSVASALASMIMSAVQCAWRVRFGRTHPAWPGPAGRSVRGVGPVGLLLLLVLGPLAASLLRVAITRSREYAADRTSARITGDPLALADALRKLESTTRRVPLPADPALRSTAALMIASPFRQSGFGRLFSTHPSTRDRVRRLEYLAGVRRGTQR
ncbi:M48 family metalloprotease [Actinopolymorpha sp. B11F2]|uniref:M48 family metalloprotease n=1 Tax=Actinopolymorpha sp. B11F2 TaxID=3160862 RepID=UPI0032E423DD